MHLFNFCEIIDIILCKNTKTFVFILNERKSTSHINLEEYIFSGSSFYHCDLPRITGSECLEPAKQKDFSILSSDCSLQKGS